MMLCDLYPAVDVLQSCKGNLSRDDFLFEALTRRGRRRSDSFAEEMALILGTMEVPSVSLCL